MNQVVFGIDPGATGAIAVLGNGYLVDVCDVPTVGRGKKGKQEINGSAVAEYIRSFREKYAGADFQCAFEEVHSMPKQGVSSTFAFGQASGIVQGVVQALGIPICRVPPQKWKRHFGLSGSEKDAARGKVIDFFPRAPVTLKKHTGRADAVLIGLWWHQTQT